MVLDIEINKEEVKQMYLDKLQERIKEVEVELVFWDMKELKRRTCMGETTLKDHFFYDPKFPKYKVGGKWYFPARETQQFLLMWIAEKGVS